MPLSALADTASTAVDIIQNAAADAKVVAKIVGPRSITRLAQDSIFQFPMLISASIDTDEIFAMAKYAEKNYAALMASVISLYGYVNLHKYDSIADYLKKFHQNGNDGGIIDLEASEAAPVSTLQSANILTNTEDHVGVAMDELWDNVTEALDTASLNDMYKPYIHTEAVLKNALKMARSVATEAGINAPAGSNYTTLQAAKIGTKIGTYNSISGATGNTTGKRSEMPKSPLGGAAVVQSKELDAGAPTMVNLQFVVDSGRNRANWMQNVVIGIKAMVRMVKSNSMIANMGEACLDRPIFKFLSWTKGETSTASIILNTSAIEEGRKSLDKKDHWINVLKARKKKANGLIGRWILGKRLMPNTTIIMTEQEVMDIADQYKVDLSNPANALKVMSKYFLLGLGIYDTESKVLDIIYDGETGFSSMSLRMLTAEAKKETNLLAMNKY